MMLKKWLDAGKCLLGAHQGDWALEAHGECRMVQVCTVCGQESRRIEHVWAPWSDPDPGTCQSVRTCTRCPEVERRVDHEWGDWTYREERSCEQARPCSRCGTWQDEARVLHEWDPWNYSEARRSPVRRCRRCRIGQAYFTGELPAEAEPAAASVGDEAGAASAAEDGHAIVRAFIDSVRTGGDREALGREALEAAAAMNPASAPDAVLVSWWTSVRVVAVLKAYTVVAAARADAGSIPNASDIRELADAYERGDEVDPAIFLQTVEGLLEQGHPDLQALRDATLPLLGLGLMFGRDSLGVFDGLRDRMVALTFAAGDVPLAGTTASHPASAGALSSSGEPRGPYDDILDAFAETLAREGFSEQAMQEAMARIKELAPETGAADATFDALLRIHDLALPHATEDMAEMLRISRRGVEQVQASMSSDAPPLTMKEVADRGEQVLAELRAARDAGEAVGPRFLGAIVELQQLAARIGDGSDAADEDTRRMAGAFVRLLDALVPHVPEEQAHVLEDMRAGMAAALDGLDVQDGDVASQAVIEQQAMQQLRRSMPTIDEWSLGSADVPPAVRQVLEAVPRLLDRVLDPTLDASLGETETREAKRLRERIDARWQTMRHAQNEQQFLRPQREGLRRASLEFREFERRRHVMIVNPALPTHSVSLDANRVFFSGSETVEALTASVCRTIGLSLPPKHGLANRAHGRWLQLREAAVMIADYSRFDPVAADPAAPILSAAEEESVLRAAGPVASVAYETGWAYVLGTPVVTVARRGRPVPFDIDVEPVLLDGTDQDAERLLAAINAAFYGTPHGIPGDCLDETIACVHRRYGNSPDEKMRQLLESLSPQDAVRARLVLEAIVERAANDRSLVTVPTFAGAYPSGHLFHVTAFREWTRAAQEETRAACERAGIEYLIGSDRLGADILGDVWRDICAASFIVADITHLNPNAVLELGIAHALGRRTLILTRNRRAHAFFPAIEKVRVHHYDPETGRVALASLLDRFLSAEEPAES